MPNRRVVLALAMAALAGSLAFVPLPRACDPRGVEVPPTHYAELLRFADSRTRAEIEAALLLVDPDKRLVPYFTLSDRAMEVRIGAQDEAPAVRVSLRATPAPARSWPRRRIALDPGHFGGAWSKLEKRHVTRGGGAPVARETSPGRPLFSSSKSCEPVART